MRRSLRRGGGTETPRPLDLGRLAAAIQREGIDPRHWASYGTVCSQKQDGTYDFEDAQAIAVTPRGCFADVLLMPTNVHVTCRYPGPHGGHNATIAAPLRVGDEVCVSLPDGDLRLPPVIDRVMTNSSQPMPTNQDGSPVWANDRVLVYCRGGKVQVLVQGGGEILVNPDGSVNINGGNVTLGAADATEQLVLGTTYRGAEHTMHSDPLTGMSFYLDQLQAAASGPLTPLKPGFIGLKAAIELFEQQAGGFLSDVAKTK